MGTRRRCILSSGQRSSDEQLEQWQNGSVLDGVTGNIHFLLNLCIDYFLRNRFDLDISTSRLTSNQ